MNVKRSSQGLSRRDFLRIGGVGLCGVGLLDFLHAQRNAVLSIVAGLDEEAWHRSVLPTGWTPAGLVERDDDVRLVKSIPGRDVLAVGALGTRPGVISVDRLVLVPLHVRERRAQGTNLTG